MAVGSHGPGSPEGSLTSRLLFKGTQMFSSVSKEVIAQTCRTDKKEDGIL